MAMADAFWRLTVHVASALCISVPFAGAGKSKEQRGDANLGECS
jgi:hypothetical protein